MLLTTLAHVAFAAHAVHAATNAVRSQICPAGCKCVGFKPRALIVTHSDLL
jgi:hypothetical protein